MLADAAAAVLESPCHGKFESSYCFVSCMLSWLGRALGLSFGHSLRFGLLLCNVLWVGLLSPSC
jgi:hypothetical protein